MTPTFARDLMTTEVWRVADDNLVAPAHLVVWQQAGVTATACNWIPSADGQFVDRAEMLTHRFGCRKCMTVSKSILTRRSAT